MMRERGMHEQVRQQLAAQLPRAPAPAPAARVQGAAHEGGRGAHVHLLAALVVSAEERE